VTKGGQLSFISSSFMDNSLHWSHHYFATAEKKEEYQNWIWAKRRR